VGAIIFCAYHILPFYYYYFELQEQFEALVRVAEVNTDQELRSKIRSYLRRAEIPAEADEVRIDRDGGRISLTLDYQEVFFIRFRGKEYDIKTFDFHVHADGGGSAR